MSFLLILQTDSTLENRALGDVLSRSLVGLELHAFSGKHYFNENPARSINSQVAFYPFLSGGLSTVLRRDVVSNVALHPERTARTCILKSRLYFSQSPHYFYCFYQWQAPLKDSH